MSLTRNNNYDFRDAARKVLEYLSSQNIDLFSVSDIFDSRSPNDMFIKIYINYPNKGIVAHRPSCPDKTNLTSGVGDASHNGFWTGMIMKDQIIGTFGSIEDFIERIGELLKLTNNSLCKRCKP